jgi:putative radical SAM enzyme (TIGR03279 family)
LNKKKQHLIKDILENSIAEEVGIEVGDILIDINDQVIHDVFDYRYLLSDEELTVHIQKPDGEEWLIDIEKDISEDLGLIFENELMDELKRCRNNCIFCFIDQLPPHMREAVYFKDDDWRMSFLYGNYITLTNMSDEDIDRLIYYRLSPVNVSIHVTNPEIRKKMLNNRFAGNILERLERIINAGIEVNGQIVLCKGINDREHLDQTIQEVSRFLPQMQSLSVVPVGISKFREGLFSLQPFEKEDAQEVLAIIHKWQQKLKKQHDMHFVFASDEFYLLAEQNIPSYETYEDFPQIENGVGMLAQMKKEFEDYWREIPEVIKPTTVSIATGHAPYNFIQQLCIQLTQHYPNLTIHVYPIINRYFGESITVAGLLTGQDLIAQLKNQPLGERLLLSRNMFRDNDTILLDDMDVTEVEKALNIPVRIVDTTGKDFIKGILDIKENTNE